MKMESGLDPCSSAPCQYRKRCSPDGDTGFLCACADTKESTFSLRTSLWNSPWQDGGAFDQVDVCLCHPTLGCRRLDDTRDYCDLEREGTSVDPVNTNCCFQLKVATCSRRKYLHPVPLSNDIETDPRTLVTHGTSENPVDNKKDQHQAGHGVFCITDGAFQDSPHQFNVTSADMNSYCQCSQDDDHNSETDFGDSVDDPSQVTDGSSVDPVIIKYCENNSNNSSEWNQRDPANMKKDLFCQCPSSCSYQPCLNNLTRCMSSPSFHGDFFNGNTHCCQKLNQSEWAVRSYQVLIMQDQGPCCDHVSAVMKLPEVEHHMNASGPSHGVTVFNQCGLLGNDGGTEASRGHENNGNWRGMGLPVGLALGVATVLLSERCRSQESSCLSRSTSSAKSSDDAG